MPFLVEDQGRKNQPQILFARLTNPLRYSSCVLAGVRSGWNQTNPSRLRRVPALAAAIVALQIAVGWLLSNDTKAAIAAAVVIPAMAMLIIRPQWLWLIAFPANYLYWRVGPSRVDLSLADVAVVLAMIAALPSVPWRSPMLQRIERLYAVYLGLMSVAFVAVPNKETLVSLMQRSSMFLGAVLIGAAVGSRGKAPAALTALLAGSSVVAIEAIRRSVQLDFDPAYPFGIQKNAAGAILGMSIIVSFAALNVFPRTKANRVAIGFCQLLLIGGLLATGARGAAVALLATLLVAVVRNEPGARRPITIAALACVAVVAVATVRSVDEEKANDRFASGTSRAVTYEAAIKLWQEERLTGIGIKYWRNPAFADKSGFGEPHNVLISSLTETGVVGLAGFLVLMGGTLLTVVRPRTALYRTAFLLIVYRLVESQFGIFWVAVGGSLPWLVLGAAIGAAHADADRKRLVTGSETGSTKVLRRRIYQPPVRPTATR